MAFQTRESSIGTHDPAGEDAPQKHAKTVDVTAIGVDVMKVTLPRYEKTASSFIQSISDTLTPLELRALKEAAESDDALQRLYLVWTLKEAYTKALGLGLGFDFKRIEVDVNALRVYVDGSAPTGWEFMAFTLESQSGNEYQVAVARFVEPVVGEASDIWGQVHVRGRVDGKTDIGTWFTHYDAATFIKRVAD